MRIKDHTDMVRHLTDPFNIPEARRMIQENPALTQEQFKMAGLSESFPGTFTSYNDAVSEGFQGTREEWLQQQSILQIERPLTGAAGGRVEMKPGGIVEPGVTHYGKKKKVYESSQYKRLDHSTYKHGDYKYPKTWEGKTAWYKTNPLPHGEGYDFTKDVEAPTNRHKFRVKDQKWIYKGQKTVDGKRTIIDYVQKQGETKNQFFKRMKDLSLQKIIKKSKERSVITAESRAYIDNWTKNWFDDNMGKYGVKEFDKMTNNIGAAWKSHLKDIDIPKGYLTKMSTRSGFPNITSGSVFQPFTYEGMATYHVADTSTPRGESILRTMFLRNKIRTTPGLKNKLKEYFDFILMDKRGMYIKGTAPTIKAFEEILDKDAIYLLSKDAGIGGASKYQLFNSFDKDFNQSYNTFQKKIDTGQQWQKHAHLIEKKLGLTKNSIRNNMRAEGKALKKIFDISSLKGTGLEYSLEHAQGMAAAARSGDKKLMELAVNDMIGATKAQNRAAGFYGFEANRGALIREINAGRNVTSNLKSLNEMTQTAYKDIGIKRNIYSVKDGQLVSKSISPAFTQEQRFGQYFKTIAKTKEGAAAIKKQHGNLENLIKNLEDAEIPCYSAKGGKCDTAADYRKGFNELVQRGAAGDKTAVSKLQKFTNLMKKAKGPLKWTGYGLLAEVGFMVPFAAADYTKGESWKRILGNATDWGFGPMFGQSEDEEIISYLPEGSLGAETEIAKAAHEREEALTDPQRNFPKGRIGMDPKRFQEAQTKVIEDASLDLRNKLDPFMEGPRDEYFNTDLALQSMEDWKAAQKQVQLEKLKRIAERRARGFIAEKDWTKDFDYRGYRDGGIVSLLKK